MVYIEGLAWDEDAEDHIARHGVTPEEVEQATGRILYSKVVADGRLAIVGQTAAGRYLAVFLDDEGEGYWYPVTARTAEASERRLAQRKPKGR